MPQKKATRKAKKAEAKAMKAQTAAQRAAQIKRPAAASKATKTAAKKTTKTARRKTVSAHRVGNVGPPKNGRHQELVQEADKPVGREEGGRQRLFGANPITTRHRLGVPTPVTMTTLGSRHTRRAGP